MWVCRWTVSRYCSIKNVSVMNCCPRFWVKPAERLGGWEGNFPCDSEIQPCSALYLHCPLYPLKQADVDLTTARIQYQIYRHQANERDENSVTAKASALPLPRTPLLWLLGDLWRRLAWVRRCDPSLPNGVSIRASAFSLFASRSLLCCHLQTVGLIHETGAERNAHVIRY